MRGRPSKAVIAARQLAQQAAQSEPVVPREDSDAPAIDPVPLAERDTLPPVSHAPRIKRVKFAFFARTGGDAKPVRELSESQALLTDDSRGVMVDGRILVPWANIYWVEYT